MKIPETFLPEISLEGKIRGLLEKTRSSLNYDINEDVKALFPNFVNYLKGKYKNLRVYKSKPGNSRYRHSRFCWRITTNHLNKKKTLGIIAPYTLGGSEHGYTADLKIGKKNILLVYRDGHGNPFTKYIKNPLRCDKEDIPFP